MTMLGVRINWAADGRLQSGILEEFCENQRACIQAVVPQTHWLYGRWIT